MKILRRLACKFDLNQSERKSSQVNASARKSWPNGVASRLKFSTCGYLRLRLARALGIKLVIDPTHKPHFIFIVMLTCDYRSLIFFSRREKRTPDRRLLSCLLLATKSGYQQIKGTLTRVRVISSPYCHQWGRGRRVRMPGKNSQGDIFLVSWDCSLYGKGRSPKLSTLRRNKASHP